jgi:hypothetical protein
MALLVVDIADPAGGRYARTVSIETCDQDGRPAVAHGADGVKVKRYEAATDGAGHLEVDIAPSDELQPVGTPYAVKVDGVLAGVIVKGPATESLLEALAGELGPVAWSLPAEIDGGGPEDVPAYDIDGGTP